MKLHAFKAVSLYFILVLNMTMKLSFFGLISCCCIFFLSCKSKTNQIQNDEFLISTEPNIYNARMLGDITIDGKLNEASWNKSAVHWSLPFGNIVPSDHFELDFETKMKLLWDEEHLYVAAIIQEEHIWSNMLEDDLPLYKENCFELFLDPGADGKDYYEIEVNPNNAVWDLFLSYPYGVDDGKNADPEYDIKGLQTAVGIKGSLNDPSDKDDHWIVEMAIPWKGLKKFGPNWKRPENLESWAMNAMSVHYPFDINEGRYIKKEKEKPDLATWVFMGKRNIHIPEKWGRILFLE